MFCIWYNYFTSFSKWADYTDIFTAMKFALETQYNQSKNDFKFRLTLANIDTVDAYKLTRIICRQVRNCIFFPISFGVERIKLEILRCRILLLIYLFQFQGGIFALMGTVDPESFDTLHSYANAFEMPFVTPWFPESMYSSSPKVCNYNGI